MEHTLRLTVLGLFLDGDEVLMIHQIDLPEPNCWDLPGGGLEASEPLLIGLAREIREETGITQFQVERLLTVSENFYPQTDQQILHTVHLIYQCSVNPRPVQLYSNESEIGEKGIQWLPIHQLRQEDCSSRAWIALQAALALSQG